MANSISNNIKGRIIHNNDWLIKKTNKGIHAFRKHLLLSGAVDAVSYSLSLSAIFNEGSYINYFFSLRFRAGKQEQLPTDIILKITNNNGSKILPFCSSDQIYSIVHNDYVSSLSASIDEADVISLYRKESYLEIVHQGESHILKLDEDDTLIILKLKKRFAPGTLSSEQKEVLLKEQIKEKEDKKRQEEEKRKQEEEKRKQEEEKRKIEEEKKLKDEQLRMQAEEKRKKEEEERRLALEKKAREEQAKRQEEIFRKKEEEKKREQQLEIRDVEIRPDAKVLAKVIFDRYYLNWKKYSNKSDSYFRPSAWEKYLPQFMDKEYLSEVENLLSKRHVLISENYHFRLNIQLFDVGSLNQIFDIIDKKTTAEEVIKNVPKVSSDSAKNKTGGCYIATCVYGSYDCPEVWTLRRFRDQSLRNSWLGRIFIKAYYATSPTLVKWFGGMKTFRTFNRKILDKLVSILNNKGFENKPYLDR